SLIAAQIAWLFLPDAPTYVIPTYQSSASVLLWALLAGPIAGFFSVGYVRLIMWAQRHKPWNWQRIVAPIIGLGLLGVVSIRFPQVLGNGKDISTLAFTSQIAPGLALILVFLKPAATSLCIRCGAPGGLFTPSLSAGAMFGTVTGYLWTLVSPGA